ncbi:MAG: tRNA uridine-5-carboxymethylaminomethyl(34) synthesis GTPase MnmE [Sphingomonadales bacterium]|nr:tRNA uridine-5-carboxymethylaminomethyl(34) synthesis GTPase MnmE [Sphingomonadales bacterium]
MVSTSNTIYALASGPGRGGVNVVRFSGSDALQHLLPLCGLKSSEPRKAHLVKVKDPKTNTVIDHALFLYFKAPHSFTGEDVVELHIHGGPAVLDAIFGLVSRETPFRLAERGEFTRRAYEHGKMDLTAAEGLNDLVCAETEGQRRLALAQMDGALADLYEGWRKRLVASLAWLEAAIDFADEELPDDLESKSTPDLIDLKHEIKKHLDDGKRGERIRLGFRIVILGAPNVGKSSLLNALAKEDVAIVSDVAGTTRDVIEVKMDLGGYAVSLIDTAGLRESADDIEREGVRRALQKAEDADLKLLMVDVKDWPTLGPDLEPHLGDRSMVLINKVDRAVGFACPDRHMDHKVYCLSAQNGEGLQDLLTGLESYVKARLASSEAQPLTRARHREALASCVDALNRYLDSIHADPAVRAEDIRIAARYLGRITGRVDVEDVLDVVFSDFCIGK